MKISMPSIFSGKLNLWLGWQPDQPNRELLLDTPESDLDDEIVNWAKQGHLPVLTEKQIDRVLGSSFGEYTGNVKYIVAPEPVVLLPIPEWVSHGWLDEEGHRVCSVWMFKSEADIWLEEYKVEMAKQLEI